MNSIAGVPSSSTRHIIRTTVLSAAVGFVSLFLIENVATVGNLWPSGFLFGVALAITQVKGGVLTRMSYVLLVTLAWLLMITCALELFPLVKINAFGALLLSVLPAMAIYLATVLFTGKNFSAKGLSQMVGAGIIALAPIFVASSKLLGASVATLAIPLWFTLVGFTLGYQKKRAD